MAITRLWFFTLKRTTSPTSPTFLSLWAQILDLCASYTPTPTASTSQVHVAHISTPHPQRPHHFLFSSSSSSSPPSSSSVVAEVGVPPGEEEENGKGDGNETTEKEEPLLFVLISSYPSLALCSQADAAYKLKFQPRLAEMVQHLALRQMDMEETETIPALLASSSSSSASRKGNAEGGSGGGGGGGGVTVTISSRDPLRVEVEESAAAATGAGRGRRSRTPVAPLDEEISGADVYQVPPAPTPAAAPALDGGGGVNNENGDGSEVKRDLFQAQRGEGRKWIRISKGWDVAHQDGEVQVFRLKEVISR